MVLAMVDDKAVSSARIEFLPARQFASLWGAEPCPSGVDGGFTERSSPTGHGSLRHVDTRTCM